MNIELASIAARAGRHNDSPATVLLNEYAARAARYTPCTLRPLRSEAELWALADSAKGRSRRFLVLADSAGRQLSSAELADEVRRFRDAGRQNFVFAVGPADGWSDAMRARADLLIAFGRITLPHELAAVILAEQVYRALTILAGHPYHTGH